MTRSAKSAKCSICSLNNIDGLILTGKQHSDRMVQYVRASGIPVAELMDYGGQQLDIQVGFDNEKAAWDMTHAFLESGKRAIAFFGSMDDPRDLSRFRGTELALAEHGLKAYHMAPRTISSVALGRQMFLQMQQTRPDIDAIFCTNDDLAVGVLARVPGAGESRSRRRSPSPVFTGWKLAVRSCKK